MPDENTDAIRELVAEWLDRARSDLILAKMTEDERITPDILAFPAQQAAEKALKALLVQRQTEFPRTHAIGPLLNLCESTGYEVAEDLTEAVTLTRYAVASRYPGTGERVTREEARAAAELATRVMDWADAQVEDVDVVE